MNTQYNRLLVVDDEEDIADYLCTVGQGLGFSTLAVSNDNEFMHALSDFAPTVILLDLQMPGKDGIELLKVLRESHCDAQIVLVSGLDDRTIATASQFGQVLGLNITATLPKPVLLDELRAVLDVSRHASPNITVDDVRSAIKAGEITAYYQPKAVLNRNGEWRISEAEALARWHRSDEDIVMPADFIGLANDAGLLPDLTLDIIKQVIREIEAWGRKGLSMCVAVNLSPSMITDKAFPDELEALMQHRGLANSQLILEITESEVMRYTAVSMEILGRFRIKGFGLAIDDFGTGYSSLEQLYRMPFNELKIDTTFIRNIDVCDSARTIVEATVMLGTKLGLSVCAEGVESQKTLDFLARIGCNKAQGFYISQAVPANELVQVIRAWNAEESALGVAG